MKLVLFGANGSAGSCIAQEALSRGHQVSAVVRDSSRFTMRHERLTVVVGNVCDPVSVAEIVKGHDAVISAAGPGAAIANDPTQAPMVVQAAHALIEGLKQAGVCRLIVVGGAGSLEVAPGVQLVDTPNFPEQYRP
ncbi:MAG: NAD(P)H-binding protein, partial [Leptolyngbyaceae cyanobacterium CAN_BIN12]|nr:NAD(P)H-binding protein [Leptolyngbyaceae cyanobacterium CAN_BIN12]